MEQLRRHILQGSARAVSSPGGAFGQCPRQSEIGYHRPGFAAAGHHHYVARLEISMNHAVVMSGMQAQSELMDKVAGLLIGNGVTLQQAAEGRPVEVLHGEEGGLTVFEKIVDAADVWMGDAACGLHFHDEALADGL